MLQKHGGTFKFQRHLSYTRDKKRECLKSIKTTPYIWSRMGLYLMSLRDLIRDCSLKTNILSKYLTKFTRAVFRLPFFNGSIKSLYTYHLFITMWQNFPNLRSYERNDSYDMIHCVFWWCFKLTKILEVVGCSLFGITNSCIWIADKSFLILCILMACEWWKHFSGEWTQNYLSSSPSNGDCFSWKKVRSQYS